MPSSVVETKARNGLVSSDADCGVTEDLCTSFWLKVTTGDVCTAVSNKAFAKIPEFNFRCLLPKCSRKAKANSRKGTASDGCCGCDERKSVGQNSTSTPSHRHGADLSRVKKEPSVTSVISSNASNVTPMTLEQVIPDYAFIMKTCCENRTVIKSIMMLLLNCHPELAFDTETLELAAFREFMLLKLNKDKTDELAAEAVSLHWQRQSRLLAQKETAPYPKLNDEDGMCKTVQCHSRPVLSDTHFVSNQPSCWSIAREPLDHKKALSQLQLSEWIGNHVSENGVPPVNLCQLPVASSMLNSVTDIVSSACNNYTSENCVDSQEVENKSCGYQSGNLVSRASLEYGNVCNLVSCSVNPDLCQKRWQTSMKIPESNNRKIDSLCNRFKSFLSLPVECSNSASVQTGTVTGVSCMPVVYSQSNKPMTRDCSSAMSKTPVVSQFMTGKVSKNNDFKGNAKSTCSSNNMMNLQELSAATEVIKTDAKPANSSGSMPNLQSCSHMCLQEFPKTEQKTKEAELSGQEIIHPSVRAVAKAESRLQSCMPNEQTAPEVTAIDVVRIQTKLNSLKSIPYENIASNSNVTLTYQNSFEQLGISSFDDLKKTANENNLEDFVTCAVTGSGDGSKIENVPRLQCKREVLGDQRASATDSKLVLNLTNFDDTSLVTINNVLTNSGQGMLPNEHSKFHTNSSQYKGEGSRKQFNNVHNRMRNYNEKRPPMGNGGQWKKGSSQQNVPPRFRHDPSFRRSGFVKIAEVGRLSDHSPKLTATNGNRRLSAHTEFNGLSHLKKPDTHRTDLRRPVKLETAPRAKGVDYPQSQNASIASGRQYILHFSYTVPSEHSMCNCHKKQDLDAFLGFSNFNLRPELREVISELDFDNPTKVQRCCLRPLLDGLDVICAEGPGSGKTTLLALSTLQHLQSSNNQVAVLVLCHTYRSMIGVYDCFRKFSAYMNNVRAHILNEKSENSQHLRLNEPQILIGSVQRVLQLTDTRPDLFLQLKHFIIEDCDVMLRQADICKNIEKIAEFVPQEKQVILVCRNILPFTCNMFKKLVPYEVNMTIPSSSTW